MLNIFNILNLSKVKVQDHMKLIPLSLTALTLASLSLASPAWANGSRATNIDTHGDRYNHGHRKTVINGKINTRLETKGHTDTTAVKIDAYGDLKVMNGGKLYQSWGNRGKDNGSKVLFSETKGHEKYKFVKTEALNLYSLDQESYGGKEWFRQEEASTDAYNNY